jgi:hypothetical protein
MGLQQRDGQHFYPRTATSFLAKTQTHLYAIFVTRVTQLNRELLYFASVTG